jgi:DHA2 family multidrug resistance protein
VIILLLPLVGTLVSRVDPRRLIGFGFAVLSASLFFMTTHLDQTIDFRTAILLRVYQSVGMAFLFVPINTLVYADVPPEKTNAVSGIVNLSRNMGGDIGIAFVTTFIARRSQLHQSYLSAHTNHYAPPFEARLNAMTSAMQHTGTSALDATHQAMAGLFAQLVQNATTLAYLDTLRVMGFVTAFMIPLLFLTKRPKRGAAPAGH